MLSAAAAALSGCGGSGGSSSGGKSVADVQSCLASAGYGVIRVPSDQIALDGPENRGPGQTGELMLARGGVQPTIGSDNADAVIAFWKSPAAASASPNARDKGLGTHAVAVGSVTVQPTTHLILYAFKAAKTPSGRRAAYQAQVNKIQGCVS